VALDFPWLGFAERPVDFDYSWTGLSPWSGQALDAAGIESFHLVVHDPGGPVGFDLIRRVPDRVRSLTVLRCVFPFHRAASDAPVLDPRPAAHLGPSDGLSRHLAVLQGKGVLDGPSYEEIRAYGRLLTRGDEGNAFLDIMDGFETTAEFEARIRGPLQARDFPAQVIWGRRDAELTVEEHGADVVDALGLATSIQTMQALPAGGRARGDRRARGAAGRGGIDR
jgi:pimeloyl-ACP methyl ester carboxylesterase